jgi:Domain of unknown function (DUF4234)
MTETTPPTAPIAEAPVAAPSTPPGQPTPLVAAPPAGPPVSYAVPPAATVGTVRGTGVCILLMFVTLGIYSLVWYFKTHDEMKRHSGQGIGGGLALVLSLLVGIAMPYVTSSEVGQLYERAGLRRPVSGATGLWYFPGTFLLIGPLVWFIKTNGALNAYWRAQGAA